MDANPDPTAVFAVRIAAQLGRVVTFAVKFRRMSGRHQPLERAPMRFPTQAKAQRYADELLGGRLAYHAHVYPVLVRP